MMAEKTLNRLRVTDDSDGVDVVDGHAALEEAIGNIFGINDKVDISKAIFTTVRADGGIWMLRYKNDSVLGAADSAGIEFNDGIERKKLCFAGSKIGIWRYIESDDSWELEFDYEDVTEPTLLSKTDVAPTAIVANKVLGTTDGSKFVFRPPTAVEDGVDEFKDFTECTEFNGGTVLNHVGKLVGVKSATQLGQFPTGDGTTSRYALLRAASQMLAHVNIEGTPAAGSDWTRIGPWIQTHHDPLSGSYYIQPDTYGGVSRAGFTFDVAGVYKLSVGCQKRDSGAHRHIIWKIDGSEDCSQFPPKLKLDANPYYWREPLFATPSDWETSRITALTRSDADAPYAWNQSAFVIIRNPTTIAISMGSGDPVTRALVDVDLAIRRIQ